MALEYSNRATIGYAELYRGINKVTVFIEDARGRLIYERILSRLWGDGVVERVFPLNGRDFVMADWNRNAGNNRYIYIIDGDLDLLSGNLLSDRNLVQLDRYCLENYLLSADAILSVLQDYIPEDVDFEKAKSEISALIDDTGSFFLGLFILYAISQKHQLGQKCVAEGSLRFFGKEGFRPVDLRNRMRYFFRIIAESIGRSALSAEIAELRTNIKNIESHTHCVSGKSHILPIVHKVSEWKYRYTGNIQVFSNQLSRHAEIGRDTAVGRALLGFVNV